MKPVLISSLVLACAACPGVNRNRAPVLWGPDEGEKLWVFPESADTLGAGGELQIFLDAHTHPKAKASFAKFTLGVGGALPVHRHDKTEEIAYILAGQGAVLSLNDSGETIETPIAEGYVWYNPRGVWHGVKNTGDGPLSMVFATIPNDEHGLMSFFRRIGVAPGKEGSPISPEALHELGRRHDLIFRDAPVHEH